MTGITLKQGQYQSLKRLLDMEYKVSEITEETGIDEKLITRSFIPKGLPARKDTGKRFWINGKQFAEWVRSMKPAKRERKLSKNEFYCTKCKQPVTPKKFTRIEKIRIDILQAICPNCGQKMNKFAKKEQP